MLQTALSKFEFRVSCLASDESPIVAMLTAIPRELMEFNLK